MSDVTQAEIDAAEILKETEPERLYRQAGGHLNPKCERYRSLVVASAYLALRERHDRLVAAAKETHRVCDHANNCGWWDVRARSGVVHCDGVCDCHLSVLAAALEADQ